MWTKFWDMSSGGRTKLDQIDYVLIELPEDEAIAYFKAQFGRDPRAGTCACCGPDYEIMSFKTLQEATAFHRNCEKAYFRPDGTECPAEEAWRGWKAKQEYQWRYIERQDRALAGTGRWGEYIPLEKFIEMKNVIVLFEMDVRFEWPEEIGTGNDV